MASVVFSTIAYSLGGGGTAAGLSAAGYFAVAAAGLVGSYIDNEILFKQRRPDNREPDYPELQNTAEGAPAVFVIGQECRVRGTVIWMSDPRDDGNGDYICDVAVSLARNPCVKLERVYAEGYEVYNDGGSHTSNAQVGVFSIEHITPSGLTYYGSVITSPSGEFDLTRFRSNAGYGLKMDGWANSVNNWGFGASLGKEGVVLYTKRLSDGSTEMLAQRADRLGAPAITTAANEAANPGVSPTVTISQTFPINNADFVTETTFFNGLPAQTKSVLISNFNNAADVPAFEGTSYFTLEKFKIDQFGRRLPEITSIVSQSFTQVTIADAITKLWDWAEMDSKHGIGLDVSALDTSKIVYGYVMSGNRNLANRLEPLMMAYDLWAQVRDGVVHFFHPDDAREWAIPEDHFGFAEAGSNAEPGLRFSPDTEASLPSMVTVQYVDIDANWEDAAQHARRSAQSVDSEDVTTIDMRSLMLTADQAVEIAERLLWTPWQSRKNVSGKLPPRYWHLLENDVVSTTHEGEAVRFVLTKVDQGANWMVEFEGYVLEQDGIYDPAGSFTSEQETEGGTDGNYFSPTDQGDLPPHMFWQLLDIPPLRDGETGEPTIQVAACAWDRRSRFTGAELQCSADGGATWVKKANITTQAVCGFVRSTSGMTATAQKGQWDLENTVQVDVLHGSLESKSRDEVYAGANLAIIGDEILSFEGAELIDTDRYELTGFLRGRMDTDIAAHNEVGERFVLLSSAGVQGLRLDWNAIYTALQWRVIATNADSDSVTGADFTPQALSMRPWQVADLTAVQSGNDWVISWDKVSRWPQQAGLSYYGLTDDDPRTYKVRILDEVDGAIQRETDVTDAETWTYTSAMQNDDFAGDQSTIYVEVGRVNSRGQESKEAEGTFTE